MPVHSRSESGIAELVIGPGHFGPDPLARLRREHPRLKDSGEIKDVDGRNESGHNGTSHDETIGPISTHPALAHNRFRLNRLRFRAGDGVATK
jgi:hypothetical protein